MRKVHLLLLLGTPVLAGALAGCFELAAVGAGAAVLSVEDRRTTGTQVEDEGIELRASNRIGERFGNKVHINVTSYNRNVLLTGEVPNAQARAEIEQIVRGLPNVRGVTNDLQVAGLSSLTARSNDGFITSKVKARFLDAGKFSPVHVKVVTEASVVYLLGIVTEKEAADAVEVARTTGGVRKVVKVFEYCRPTDAVCRPGEPPKGEAPKSKSGT
jgi:osmotically-inducible protein OsmY